MSADYTLLGGATAQNQGQNQANAHDPDAPDETGARPVDERPRSVYEIVTRQMLEDVRADLAEVKARVNTLLWLVAGAVVLDWLARLLG
jgi:hypothetical protein